MGFTLSKIGIMDICTNVMCVTLYGDLNLMTNEEKWKNKAECLACKDIIESKHVHDFVKCGCGKIFVDGGNDYWRAGGDLKLFKRVMERRDL